LFEHQAKAVTWLAARKKAYLGDAPGLGKTLTLLTAAYAAGARRILAICPASVVSHWYAQHEASGGNDCLHVISYESAVLGGYRKMQDLLNFGAGYDTLIVDEAHYCKHADSKRAQIIFGRNGYARRIERNYLASGTPVPRHPGEFGTVLCSVFPEVALAHGLRTPADVAERFTTTRGSYVRGAWREKVVGIQNAEEFRAILGEVMLRRTVEEVGLDVPQIFYQSLSLDGDIVDASPALRAMVEAGETSDAQVARYRRQVGEAKIQPVVDLLAAQCGEGGQKIVVFAHHTNVLERLQEGLLRYGAEMVYGATLKGHRDYRVNNFREDPACQIFLGQNTAVGVGMDGLQGVCDRVILVEPDWTATGNEQMIKRVARIGSSAKRVIAQFVSLAGTLDDWIVRQNVREVAMGQEMFPDGHGPV
jgi:SWI/SNF-related matrix-associated actin-dependent regulator 1 of chromatin subfamily A